MDKQRLELALRRGPPFATRYVPPAVALDEAATARHPVSVGGMVLITAVTALLLVGLLGGLVALGMLQQDDRGASNGWIAFARYGSDRSAGEVERDIYIVREGQAARRIIGSDSDELDQICPAFSPDGTRLAHGEATGSADSGYSGAALVVSDLDREGDASESLRIEVGGSFPPPCALWSADGRRIAFGVPTTSPLNPTGSAAGSQVWVATIADGHVEVLPELLASDLEWSPRSTELAIVSGQTDRVGGLGLRDGSIRIYDAESGETRTLVDPSGVSSLTWSPDGSRIAYQRSLSSDGEAADRDSSANGSAENQEIWVAQADGGGEYLLTAAFSSIHGIGPVWSPAGDRIVYQRCDANPCSGEAHEVVLVTPDGESQVVVPELRLPGTDASARWFPWRATWSPDGTQLLYTAWSFDGPFEGNALERTALISVPIDQSSAPAKLHEDASISPYDDKGRAVPIQSWQRVPSDQTADPTPSTNGTPVPTPAPPSEEEVTQLLNAFVEARVAGAGAQQYLNAPESEVPLLYATSSGAAYERGELEEVRGIEWPYGWKAYTVRLVAGETVAEQLFFIPHDDPEHFPTDGHLRLEYQPDAFGTHIAPSTEDGEPVPVPGSAFDGEVTLLAPHPWVLSDGFDEGSTLARLIPDGPGVLPTTDGGQRIDWDELVLIADPSPVDTGCQTTPPRDVEQPLPADAETLAEAIHSEPDLRATAPVAVSVGGVEAVVMDLAIDVGAEVCTTLDQWGDFDREVVSLVFDRDGPYSMNGDFAFGRATGDRIRLYLFDAPEGSSMRVLAMAIVAPESRLERTVEAAAPIIESVEFHAP